MKRRIIHRVNHRYNKFRTSKSPQFNLVLGFLIYMLVGFLLLSLPIFHKLPVSFLDNLFIAASAISTTGLVTVSVSDSYNLGGQLVVAALIQLGGIGYMTLTTYYLLFTTKTISHWHRRLMGTEFALPKDIEIQDFLRSVVLFTLVMEILGAIFFFIGFADAGMAFGERLWSSIFHSISAFCTAGFGLDNNSFVLYQNDVLINTVISVLAIAGSLGFIVITDLYYRLSGRSKSLTFTTRMIVTGFLLLLGFGTLLVRFTEPTIYTSGESMWLKSFFQAMTAMTTVGFNTIDTGALSLPILMAVIFLMYIGASPSGTAGGMKITTLTAMIAILSSRLKGKARVSFLGRRIPGERLFVATSIFILYTSLIFLATTALTYSEAQPLDKLLFEVASALGTVGLSTGITGSLSVVGKVIFILLMFVGRVGVLTFGFALLERKQRKESKVVILEDDLAI
ncbi:MAG: potassium transporter TrkG [Saprospiraceae bacterium]